MTKRTSSGPQLPTMQQEVTEIQTTTTTLPKIVTAAVTAIVLAIAATVVAIAAHLASLQTQETLVMATTSRKVTGMACGLPTPTMTIVVIAMMNTPNLRTTKKTITALTRKMWM
jgi:hypothetical protein